MFSIRPINTAILRRRFPKEYRRFFLNNEIVVSTAFSFMWAGEYSAYYGGISVCQKVPFRLYAGLKPISEKKIKVKKDYRLFLRSKDVFIRASFQEDENKKINDYLNKKYWSQITKKGGCEISFLSEASEEEGFSSICVSSALISLILHLNYSLLEKNDIDLWRKVKISQLIKKDQWFDKVFSLAKKINEVARDGVTSGTNAFVALVNSGGFPIIYGTEKKFSLGNKDREQFQYNGERMIDLLSDNPLSWYFDYGLIYSGICRVHGGGGNRAIKRTQEDLDQIKDDKLIKKLQLSKINSLYAHYSQRHNPWMVFVEMFDLISFRILLGLKNIFAYGSSTRDFVFFRDAINQHWIFFKLLDLNVSQLDLLAREFKAWAKKENESGAGTKIAGLSVGGCLVFIVPKNTFLGKEGKIEKKLQEKVGAEAHINYLSWLDGIEDGGVKVEQNLRQGIYSALISQDEIEVKDYNHSYHPINRLFVSDELEPKSKKIDLVLDEINHHLYLKGKRLTSKEISSAKETIRVLALLLQKKGTLNNTDLPSNSYSTNRYDFAGKILLPLKRAVKKILKKDLNLTVQGKIFSFSINFDPYNLRIWLINRRH